MIKRAKKVAEKAVLIIIDVQNDFCPGGSLAVPHGDEVVAPLNSMVELFNANEFPVFVTRDWHPAKTKHFKDYGGIWPPHCVQHTFGACFHSDLRFIGAEIITKGTSEDEDEKSYSGFGGVNFAGQNLAKLLTSRHVANLYIGELATDYCVKATALDALKLGFRIYLLKDAVRAVNINTDDGKKAIAEMKKAGAKIITTKEVLGR